MDESFFISQLIAVVAVVICLLYLANKFIEYMYKRKERPKTTSVKCPANGEYLKDFELASGHCVSCKTKKVCIDSILKNFIKSDENAKDKFIKCPVCGTMNSLGKGCSKCNKK